MSRARAKKSALGRMNCEIRSIIIVSRRSVFSWGRGKAESQPFVYSVVFAFNIGPYPFTGDRAAEVQCVADQVQEKAATLKQRQRSERVVV